MAITWRDAMTTLTTVGAILVERAYFHSWSWPLVHQVGWATVTVALLGLIAFGFGYALDRDASLGWAAASYLFTFIATALTLGGLVTQNSDYLVLLTITVGLFWLTSIIVHAAAPHSSLPRHDAPLHT